MKEVDTTERGICNSGSGACGKLNVTDWLKDIKTALQNDDIIEVRFKNTRKDYYRNVNNLKLEVGDLIAVEGSPGHDIGIVSLMGELVFPQMKRHKVTFNNGEFRKVYRKAKTVDEEKWKEAIALEHETMIKSRQIVQELGLKMKIGDVEYQGDGTKAIFYYIADGRVDFRELIKVLADTFRIRIEMKQIGARQEAGRIGGIGPCGRELCCSAWLGNFVSVTTNAARYQDISLNPQKLAGQCGKLKCCLNFELDSYIDAQKDFPSNNIPLHSENLTYYYVKSDIFGGIFWYAPQGNGPSNLVAVPVDRVKEVIRMNRKGEKPERLVIERYDVAEKKADSFTNVVGQDDLHRFDRPKKQNPKKNRNNRRKTNRRAGETQNENKSRTRGARPEKSQGSRRNDNQGKRQSKDQKQVQGRSKTAGQNKKQEKTQSSTRKPRKR